MIIEKDIENYLVSRVKKAGGLIYKFTSPSKRAVPDRLIIYRGRHVFVELKRPQGKARRDQLVEINRMERHGADVRLIDTKLKVDRLIDELEARE